MRCEFEGLIFGLAYTWKGFAIFQCLCFGESIIPLFLSWCYDNGINAQMLVNDLPSFS